MMARTKDMTVGNPTKLILFFSLPIIAGSLLQQFYSLVDSLIVGRQEGVAALSAINASGWLDRGVSSLAIGLALQGSLANIAGGFVLVIAKPFAIGDFIISGDISGTVEEIGIFHTKIITIDNKRIVVPNSTISNATLVNATAMKTRRVDLTFTASYDNDIDKVERVLTEVCRAHRLVLDDPAPFARLSAHKDSALEYTVRAWCNTDDYWTVYFDLFRDVKNAFDKNGISIPYPQVDVHTKP